MQINKETAGTRCKHQEQEAHHQDARESGADAATPSPMMMTIANYFNDEEHEQFYYISNKNSFTYPDCPLSCLSCRPTVTPPSLSRFFLLIFSTQPLPIVFLMVTSYLKGSITIEGF